LAAALNGTSAGGDIGAFLFAKWRYQTEHAGAFIISNRAAHFSQGVRKYKNVDFHRLFKNKLF
jgi:hypothetical protein